MKNCRDIEVLLQLYIDGELPAEVRAQVEEHCDACPSCKAQLLAYEQLDALLRCQLSPVEPPVGFSSRVLAALPDAAPVQTLSASQKATARKPRRVRWLGAVTAAALVVACVFGFGSLLHGSQPQPSLEIAGLGSEQPRVAEHQQVEITRPIVADVEPLPVTDPADSPDEPDLPAAPPTEEESTETDIPADQPDTPAPSVEPPTEPLTPDSQAVIPPENSTTYTSIVDLPKVAYGGASHGSYALKLLASVEGCDAILPQIVDGIVYFYTELDEVYLEWQVDVAAAEAPFCLGQVEELPAAAGLGQDNGDGTYTALLYHQTAISGPDGLWLHEGGEATAPVQLSEVAGGMVLSWSPDGNRLLYTDFDGYLYVYYLAEELSLAIHNAPVGSACWNTDSRTIVFSAVDPVSGFCTVSSVTVP